MRLARLWISILLLPPLPVLAVEIPRTADPGVIMQHTIRNWELQRTQPWLYRPLSEEDYETPSDENLIQYCGKSSPNLAIPPGAAAPPVIRIPNCQSHDTPRPPVK